MAPIFSVPVPFSEAPGHTATRRSIEGHNPSLSCEGSTTLFEVFQRGLSLSPNRPCVGFRPINERSGEAGDYEWLTYTQVNERAVALGAGLVHLGACTPNEDGMKVMGFFAKNRLEWIVGEQACYRHNIIPVPLYDVFGPDAVGYVAQQTTLTATLCSLKELDVVLRVAEQLSGEANGSILKVVVLMDEDKPSAEQQAKADTLGVKVMTIGQVEDLGRKNPHPATPPTGKDIAFFCYTSGTTGDPKGALLSHSNMVSSLVALHNSKMKILPSDVHLSYLPLPHVFERVIQVGILHAGAAIGFFQGNPLLIMDDLAALRPTMFPSVPRLLNRLVDKIEAGAAEAGGVKAWLFATALSSKIAGIQHPTSPTLTHPIWDTLVFGPLKKRLGFDRMRFMVTGSAPISERTLTLLRVVFGIPVIEGYGQTETSALLTTTLSDDYSAGHVGGPSMCNEVRLVDVPEMGYLSTDRTHGEDAKSGAKGIPVLGRGEICVRGPNVFVGYYKMPDKTAETVDAEGWCHTGDVGVWMADGHLKIVDRLKNIFKLAQGEYVAAEKIENVIARSPFIAQSFVYGDSLQSQLVAVIVLDPEHMEVWAKKSGVTTGTDMAAWCADPKVKAVVMEEVKKASKQADLKSFEVPRNIYLEAEMFTAENGLLTPTFKLKRPVARDNYREQIDVLYAQLGASKM